MQLKNTLAPKLFAALATVALGATLSACSGKTVLAGDWQDDSYVITAEKCKSDGMMMINYTIEDDCDELVVKSELESGTLHITLGSAIDVDAKLEEAADEDADAKEVTDSTVDPDMFTPDETLYEIEATGTGEQVIEVEPGDYSLTVAGDDDAPAKGTVTITPKSES